MDDPDCFRMELDLPRDATRFQARVHIISPHELQKLLTEAFMAGQYSLQESAYYLP